ncbi:hypothetical protein H5410_045578 [Solanum commersonii]|uniref:Uncharacterized protein n=1 Tax=Solanum commersonii TaxID=4109 RepID=A0A9J5XE30_SOLCO|nr:hypothetical protein H5410_045578 [Solanum commersonii]
MCGHTRSDKIRNKVIRKRWEWPMWWTSRGEIEMVWTCEEADAQNGEVRGLVVECVGGRGRPKKYWGEVIRRDLAHFTLPGHDSRWKEWRSRLRL